LPLEKGEPYLFGQTFIYDISIHYKNSPKNIVRYNPFNLENLHVVRFIDARYIWKQSKELTIKKNPIKTEISKPMIKVRIRLIFYYCDSLITISNDYHKSMQC
jgi:hypothetical protein